MVTYMATSTHFSSAWLGLSGVNMAFPDKATTNKSQPQSNFLDLNLCNLTEFPQILHVQDELNVLDLSYNRIHGKILPWLVNITRESPHLSQNLLTSYLNYLNVSDNNLGGQIPDCISESESPRQQLPRDHSLFIPQILLKGSIPRLLINCIMLKVLDIGQNHVKDTFHHGSEILILRHNNFHGRIIGISLAAGDVQSLNIIWHTRSTRITSSLVIKDNILYTDIDSWGSSISQAIITSQVGFRTSLVNSGGFKHSTCPTITLLSSLSNEYLAMDVELYEYAFRRDPSGADKL
ncbi:hypothetical protein Cgig2_014265 [Carnegiea gigantea]|uniref:Uncharacterized protein n=1 Tax=Carnegiea gigantea TaxID=171969 RepID=A0A9Q1K373_9CARY|nr:hypothetical protein Cgig2_014265 [Carnegiea gigantea]